MRNFTFATCTTLVQTGITSWDIIYFSANLSSDYLIIYSPTTSKDILLLSLSISVIKRNLKIHFCISNNSTDNVQNDNFVITGVKFI